MQLVFPLGILQPRKSWQRLFRKMMRFLEKIAKDTASFKAMHRPEHQLQEH